MNKKEIYVEIVRVSEGDIGHAIEFYLDIDEEGRRKGISFQYDTDSTLINIHVNNFFLWSLYNNDQLIYSNIRDENEA